MEGASESEHSTTDLKLKLEQQIGSIDRPPRQLSSRQTGSTADFEDDEVVLQAQVITAWHHKVKFLGPDEGFMTVRWSDTKHGA